MLKLCIMNFLFNSNTILKNTPSSSPDLLTNKEFFQNTIAIAWPATLEAFLMSLVTFIDTMMVGSLGSFAIAAVGLTNQPKFICLATFFAINMAVGAIVARRKGQGRQDKANQTLLQSIVLVIILGAIISTLALTFVEPIVLFAGSQPDTHDESVVYFRIITAGLIFQALTMVINACQRGVGNTKISMKSNLTMSLVNVILNFLLINGNLGFPALGVKGAAIATLVGFFVGFLMSFFSILKPKGYLYLFSKTNTRKFQKEVYVSIYKVGIGSFIEQIFIRVGFLLYALVVANLGTDAFAAHQIGMTIITISFSIGDGLSAASISLVGQSLGQKRPDYAKVYGAFCQHIGLFFSIIIAIVYTFFGELIFRLFAQESEVLIYSDSIMKLIGVIVILQVAQVILSGCLRGAGDTKYTAMVSLISIAVLRPLSGWLFVTPLGLGLIGAWLSLLLDQSVRFVLTYIRFKNGKWQKIDF